MNALGDEFKEILEKQKDIVYEFKKEPALLDRLYGLMTDLYIDRFKLKGTNVKAKVPELIQLLDNYNHESLVKFYGGKINEDF